LATKKQAEKCWKLHSKLKSTDENFPLSRLFASNRTKSTLVFILKLHLETIFRPEDSWEWNLGDLSGEVPVMGVIREGRLGLG
jgi:hypothetical protein